jgi:hypothetical protein
MLTPFLSIQRFVNFFEAICAVNGKAIKSNQEMVLRETWMNEEKRKRTFLKTAAFDLRTNPATPALRELGPVFDASGTLTAGLMDSSVLGKPPPKFIGQDIFENNGCFPSVFVQWTGAKEWAENMDELFWSPESMGLTVYSIQGEEWVLLQEFAWVLDRSRLCEVFTKKNWSELEAESKKNPKVAAQLLRQNQLAEYYVGQLILHGKQCLGRSSNCIDWFAKSYPYTTLVAIAYSPHLPAVIRSAACDLIMSLYLDRYHEVKFEDIIFFSHCMLRFTSYSNQAEEPADISNIPLIPTGLRLEDDAAMPAFNISSTHKLFIPPNQPHADPFMSFPGHTKFYLLRRLGNMYLESFGEGQIAHSSVQENQLASSIVGIISSLTKFGFQSTHPKVRCA